MSDSAQEERFFMIDQLRSVEREQAKARTLADYARHDGDCVKGKPTLSCPRCLGELKRVTQGANSMLNSYQFDAVKAGDYYCATCQGDEAQRSGYKYWWARELGVHPCTCGLDHLLSLVTERPRQEKEPSPSRAVEEARAALEVCRACGGQGEYEVERHVTRDMAIDAGEPSMEGMAMSERERCEECYGAGYIPDERVDALISAVREADQREIERLTKELEFTRGDALRGTKFNHEKCQEINALIKRAEKAEAQLRSQGARED